MIFISSRGKSFIEENDNGLATILGFLPIAHLIPFFSCIILVSFLQNSENDCDELIDKWRSACQEAAMDLLGKSNEKITLDYLLKCLDVDTKLLHYNGETDCFE